MSEPNMETLKLSISIDADKFTQWVDDLTEVLGKTKDLLANPPSIELEYSMSDEAKEVTP